MRFIDIFRGVFDDLAVLIRQEGKLLRDEVKLEVSKATRAFSGFGIGIALSVVGALFILLMVVHGLHELLAIPFWASHGIVGGTLVIIAVVLMLRARSLAHTVHAMPERTMFSMRENVQWIKEHTASTKT